VGAIGIHEGSIIRDVNQAAVDLTGYDYEELIGMSGLDLIDPAWRSVVAECIRSGYEQPYEVVGLRKDGSTYPLEIQGKQIPFQGRSFRLTEFRDITWRKEAERSLAESEEKYRLVVENASDAICIAQDERLPFSNPRAIETLGYTEKELKTLSFLDLIHPDDRQMVWERYRQRLAGGNPPGTYEFRVVSKQGTTIPVSLSSVGITWEGRPATLNFLRDITQQKEWDRRAHQIQRMEAIGTLAGGIAHNVNNTLMGIQGRASLMMMDKDVSHPDYEHLRGIEEYVRSAAELTRDLLGFAKGGKYQVKPVDVNALLVHENRMFTRTKKEICIREKFEQRLWTVEADKGQMRQMLMNLYVNAWQAMPSGGEIYVRTENVIVDEEDVQSIEIEAGRYVKISITDTGVGMDAATREKIFDPFFTTRDVNVGTGLGLASVYGIVKNHGGFINVYSERGRGATFTIYLPASNNKVVEEKQTSARLFKGEGTILLVDDEQMILDVGERFLHQVGYEVITARSGSEAVDLYEKNRERILLVVLDMIMPAMSGGETFDRLKAIDPNVKVLLSSGYSINGQAQEILDRGCCGFIQKPFQMEHLSQKLVEVLKPAS
jgi:PAS domain S-box-containing protein